MHTYGAFHNYHFDWLTIENPYKNLRQHLNLSRDDLAGLFKISAHSIRRYETENKAPHWYLMLLRITAGDLSYFGGCWDGVTIRTHDRKLTAPELKRAILPVEFNRMYNQEARHLRAEIKELRSEIKALKEQNRLLTELARHHKSRNEGIKKGDVIPLFGR